MDIGEQEKERKVIEPAKEPVPSREPAPKREPIPEPRKDPVKV